jgi:hypothetical protein
MSNLAVVLDNQGKYEEAESMNRQTLAWRDRVLGPEHPDTLTSVYCLAHLLANLHGPLVYLSSPRVSPSLSRVSDAYIEPVPSNGTYSGQGGLLLLQSISRCFVVEHRLY